jgi:hypothetical protein
VRWTLHDDATQRGIAPLDRMGGRPVSPGKTARHPAAKSPVKRSDSKASPTGDWRVETLARIRALIQAADPEVVEEIKWKKPSNPSGVPVWSHDGIICTGETYRDKVKLTFAKGAALDDPSGLFNASLDAGSRRAIDIHAGGKLNEAAFRRLIKAAVALNRS